jgi:hypothetical protein
MKVRDKYLLIMAAVWGPCLALAAGFYTLVLRPQINDRRQLDVQVAQAQAHYTRAVEAAKPEGQARLMEELDRLDRRTADFLVRFEETPDLAFEIGRLAHESRLESFGMKPTGTRAPETLPAGEYIGEKRVNVSFSAGFTRLAAFLNALERHQPVIFVETFTIHRPLELDAEPRVDMQLAVLVERPRRD